MLSISPLNDSRDIYIYVNCRKSINFVETPQDPKRALGRMNIGGLGRNRTTDTRIFNPLLNRLSYRACASNYISVCWPHRRCSGGPTQGLSAALAAGEIDAQLL